MPSLTGEEALAAIDALYPPPIEAPPVIPPPPTASMSVRDSVIAERRRLRALGLVEVAAARLDGYIVLRVTRESGDVFHCRAASEHGGDIADAIDDVLTRRIERDRALQSETVARLRRKARRLEDSLDTHEAKQRALDRIGIIDRGLTPADKRYGRADRDLYQAQEAAP